MRDTISQKDSKVPTWRELESKPFHKISNRSGLSPSKGKSAWTTTQDDISVNAGKMRIPKLNAKILMAFQGDIYTHAFSEGGSKEEIDGSRTGSGNSLNSLNSCKGLNRGRNRNMSMELKALKRESGKTPDSDDSFSSYSLEIQKTVSGEQNFQSDTSQSTGSFQSRGSTSPKEVLGKCTGEKILVEENSIYWTPKMTKSTQIEELNLHAPEFVGMRTEPMVGKKYPEIFHSNYEPRGYFSPPPISNFNLENMEYYQANMGMRVPIEPIWGFPAKFPILNRMYSKSDADSFYTPSVPRILPTQNIQNVVPHSNHNKRQSAGRSPLEGKFPRKQIVNLSEGGFFDDSPFSITPICSNTQNMGRPLLYRGDSVPGNKSQFILSPGGTINNIPIIPSNWESKTLIQNAYHISKDQFGCRMLQKKLEENNQQVNSAIFFQLLPHFGSLMIDPFGNYLCQKLLEVCDQKELQSFLDILPGIILEISKNSHGTRVIQKVIELIKDNKTLSITLNNILCVYVVELSENCHGNHVIQKCVSTIRDEWSMMVFDIIIENCVRIGKHPQGCCVLQKCLELVHNSRQIKLAQNILLNIYELIKDPFGNYVVQYVVKLANDQLNIQIASIIKHSILELCKNKFASHPIEIILECSPQAARIELINEILLESNFTSLLMDPFGNYIIQKILKLVSQSKKNEILNMIRPQLEILSETNCGKRISNKLQKIYFQGQSEGDRDNSLFIMGKQ